MTGLPTNPFDPRPVRRRATDGLVRETTDGALRLTTEVVVDAVLIDEGPAPEAADALSAPTVDEMLAVLLALLPQGAAWGSADGAAPPTDSVRAKTLRGLAAGLAGFYASLNAVALSSTTATQRIATDDWEIEFGLPDACAPEPGDLETRRQTVRDRRRARAVTSVVGLMAYLQRLARPVEVNEFRCFRVGDPIGNLPFLVADAEWMVRFAVDPEGQARRWRIGNDPIGTVPLTTAALAEDLACLIRRVLPAELIPVISFRSLRIGRVVTEPLGGRVTTDGDRRVTTNTSAYQLVEASP